MKEENPTGVACRGQGCRRDQLAEHPARIAALAGPGEILASGTVTDLVVGSGVEFDSRGVHALKGVPGEWRVYAVA